MPRSKVRRNRRKQTNSRQRRAHTPGHFLCMAYEHDGELVYDPFALFCPDCGELHEELAEDDSIWILRCACGRAVYDKASNVVSGRHKCCGLCHLEVN